MATDNSPQDAPRKRVVVVGLGMVGIAFIEKLMKLDARRREYDIVVVGEEPHLAYNRVGLTSFFQHRKIEDLFLNPADWYSNVPEGSLNYHLNTLVTEINPSDKTVLTSSGQTVSYDILVLATGSDAILPQHTPGYNANGVFVYRTIDDLQKLIKFSSTRKGTTGAVVGGGLLGLEAAKAMMDLEEFSKVRLIERNQWVLSRQLDSEAGGMVVDQVRQLGLDVMLGKRVSKILTDDDNYVSGVIFEDGEEMECSCICFAIGIKPRDELARMAGLQCATRGGIVIGPDLSTSNSNIYAIGECASWENQTFGLIAPGIEMADVLSFNLTQAKAHKPRKFAKPDLSTKLKLLGIEVASFGDFFADRDGPRELSSKRARKEGTRPGEQEKDLGNKTSSSVKAMTFKDPFQQVYKKYLFTPDGKYLLGGMMIGETKDYIKMVAIVKKQKPLEVPPSEFIVGGQKNDEDGSDLPNDAQICSCHNVSKGDVVKHVKDGSCKSIGDVKSCTKAGTGCGGCMPLVQTIFNQTMKSMGQEIKNHLCPHFEYSRADLFNIIFVKKIQSFESIMKDAGKDPNSVGCEVCKPTIGSIISSLFNAHLLDKSVHGLQDTNDKFLANIQRNGTFSVIPRVAGGEITPEKLIVIGKVAKKYNLYTKITGGQRIDMFGARKQDLPAIWTELIAGGMESGHAYAKSLRTVKSCVGTTWCRFGIGDSVGMAVRLEERYKSIRSPHKIKGGVSGCVRECAEAQNKDFGLIATEKGFNIFVGGNGGAKPRHSELLAQDVPPDEVIPILDRYLSFYIRTADRLQRTARWIENLPGGIKYLREVILEDRLGICAELEKQMMDLVGTFFCEWTEVIKDPERLKLFEPFANETTGLTVDSNGIIPALSKGQDVAATTNELPSNGLHSEPIELINEREQTRPAYWSKDPTEYNFRGQAWSELTWQPLVLASSFRDVPTGDSKAVRRSDTQLAIFKIRGRFYCTQQMCPHKRAFVLSDGLIGEDVNAVAPTALESSSGASKCKEDSSLWISCPMHKRNFTLNGADAGGCSNDSTLNIATFATEEREDGWVYVQLPPVDELDSVLGTARWKVRKEESEDPFKALDVKLQRSSQKGRKGIKASHLDSVEGKIEGGISLNGSGRGSNGIDW